MTTTAPARVCRRCGNPHHAKNLCRLCYGRHYDAGLITTGLVDAGPVAQRITEHDRRNRPVEQLATLATVNPHTLRAILAGRRRIQATTARKVMAVPLPPTQLGCIRMVQALQRIGYSHDMIDDACGVGRGAIRTTISHRRPFAVGLAMKLAEAYGRLEHVPGPSTIAAAHAARRNYASPLAWDDIDTDPVPVFDADPGWVDLNPGLDAVAVWKFMTGQSTWTDPGGSPRPDSYDARQRAARDEAIRLLLQAGKSTDWIADKVGCPDRKVDRMRAKLAARRASQESDAQHEQEALAG